MANFTPGPWHIAGALGEWVNDERNANICRVNPDVSLVSAGKYVRGNAPHSGNARLIAAAPDLFHAAAWMVGVLDTWANNESEEHIFAADATFEEAEEALREAVARVKEA